MEFVFWAGLSFLALYPISMGVVHYASHRWPALIGVGVHATHHHVIHASNFAPERRLKYSFRPWFAEQVFTPAIALGLCSFALGMTALLDIARFNYAGFCFGFGLAHIFGVYLGDQYHRPRSWMDRFAWYQRAVARHREHHEMDGRENFEIVPWGEPFHWCAKQIAAHAARLNTRRQTFAR
jgi:hypothetical protein